MAKAYLSLGSNLGDREKNIQKALHKISSVNGLAITNYSTIYETEPLGPQDQNWFLNLVIETETTLSPQELLRKLKQIEKNLGRKPTVKWGPRIIDIDILLYDNRQVDEPDLKIPHPRMFQRAFVLVPLMELLPELKSSTGKSLDQLVNELIKEQKVRPYKKLKMLKIVRQDTV